MPSYAVIGASRGIGLEFVRQLVGESALKTASLIDHATQAVRPDTTVYAVVRNAAKSTHLQDAIKSLKNVHVVEADVVDHISLEARSPASRLRRRVADIAIHLQQAAQQVSELSGGTLDYLIHNAAHISDELFEGYETLWAAFSVQHHPSTIQALTCLQHEHGRVRCQGHHRST